MMKIETALLRAFLSCGFYEGDLTDGFGWVASWVWGASAVTQEEMLRAAIVQRLVGC